MWVRFNSGKDSIPLVWVTELGFVLLNSYRAWFWFVLEFQAAQLLEVQTRLICKSVPSVYNFNAGSLWHIGCNPTFLTNYDALHRYHLTLNFAFLKNQQRNLFKSRNRATLLGPLTSVKVLNPFGKNAFQKFTHCGRIFEPHRITKAWSSVR
jgi:hypothetical protein